MQSAAKNLVPVTLELGGKSPAIVDETADIDLAARRIVWGKLFNAGQTCVAPDYVYVHQSIKQTFLEKAMAEIKKQLGPQQKESKSFARIVNDRNFERLAKMIDKEKVAFGGETDPNEKYIQPTLLQNVTWDDPVMQEEIFGPILPVLEYADIGEVYKSVRQMPKPLSAYLFSQSEDNMDSFNQNLSFGGGCINDVIFHLSNPHLPFGGVGDSGSGSYHGEQSFITFSHCKSIMYRYGFLDLDARYGPYTDKKLKVLKRVLGF